MENLKAPQDQDANVISKEQGQNAIMGVEIIKKPRTMFTNNCLRRVIP